MAKKRSINKNKKTNQDNNRKIFAFLAVFLTIIGFIIALAFKKNDKYIMFYAKQGLVLFIGQVILVLLESLPIIGWFLLGPIIWILWIILWIIAWINALSGEQKDTLIIGDIAKKINL